MMTEIKTHYSCAELAEMKLSGMPTDPKSMRAKAVREGWAGRSREGRGGGYEYQPPAKIMALIREHTLNKMVAEAGEIEPIKQELVEIKDHLVNPGHLKDWQREIGQARLAICREVQRMEKAVGKEKAVREIIKLAENRKLPERLQQAADIANAKKGEKRALSRTSIYRWLGELNEGIAKLAPKNREPGKIPDWAPFLLKIYSQPQKPALAHCVELLAQKLPAEINMPSYSACRRFIEKMSNVDRERGRMGSREIKNILPFVRRDTRGMLPTECYTADGHTFDAEVCHPAHGKPFRPEITTVIDIASRRVTGWSAGLAESAWTVLDALRHACVSCGIPAIFYVDNGSGFKNDMMNNEVTGFMDRLGIELSHSLPYGSQARGIIERAQQTLWVKAAKMLPTYMGKDMDPQAKQKVFKITRKDIKTIGTSRLLIEWPDFLAFCQKQVDDYNNRPHSSLQKIRAADGTKRHQTPNEAWADAVTDGWQPVEVEAHEREDLFRPYKTAKVIRGEIKLFGNLYFHRDLTDYHGETLRVGYDIHDGNHVWVRDREGRLICVAEFEANSRRYFPESFSEQAKYKRAQGRIKRAEARIEEAQAEIDPPELIEYQPAETLPPMPIKQSPDMVLAEEAEHLEDMFDATNIGVMPTEGAKRPWFTSDAEKYRWLMHLHHRGHWTKHDINWITDFVKGEYYWDMKEIFARESIVWTSDDDFFAAKKMQKLEEEEAKNKEDEEDEVSAAR